MSDILIVKFIQASYTIQKIYKRKRDLKIVCVKDYINSSVYISNLLYVRKLQYFKKS